MCIHDHAIFVLSFIEYVPVKANRFEGPIKDVDNKAEDILEYFMWNQIHKPIMLMLVMNWELSLEHKRLGC
ncbi:hypothetical protein ACS0TY_023731 [Phlomoides rotata]